MKRRVYAAVNADIDRAGLKSAIKALFDDIARKYNISGYTINSLHLDKTGVRNPKCTCTIYYELEGYASWYRSGPSVILNVPVGVEIPEDYYLDDPEIEAKVMNDDLSEISELNALDAQARDMFDYFTEVAEDLARKHMCTISCTRYPETLEPGKRKHCHMYVQIVDVNTKYTVEFDERIRSSLTLQSEKYYSTVEWANFGVKGYFPEDFSKQIIDSTLRTGFNNFEDRLRTAERNLDSAQDDEVRADDCLQFIANLCESYGCTFESSDMYRGGVDIVSVGRIGAINCIIGYNGKSSIFDLRDYMYEPTAKVKKSIQARIRRLKTTDPKPRSKKHEQEDLDW